MRLKLEDPPRYRRAISGRYYAAGGPGGGGAGGSGDVVGPGSATDNAVCRFDLATGKLIQNSSVIVDDSGNIQVPISTGLDTAAAGAFVLGGTNCTTLQFGRAGGGCLVQCVDTTRLYFRDTGLYIYSSANGQLDIEADGTLQMHGDTLTQIGVAGDTQLGDGTLRVVRPNTDQKIDLGTTSYWFNKGYFADGCHTIFVSQAAVNDPPTDAQCDTAYGGAPAAGQTGLTMYLYDSTDTKMWHCMWDGSNWWHVEMTKAL